MFLPSNITLKFGDSGDFVAELQRRLALVRAFPDDQINGFYDGTTVNAVTHFQSVEGLRADGVAGPETLRRLNGVISGDTSSANTGNKQEEEQKTAAFAIIQDLIQTPPEPAYDPFAQATPAPVHQAPLPVIEPVPVPTYAPAPPPPPPPQQAAPVYLEPVPVPTYAPAPPPPPPVAPPISEAEMQLRAMIQQQQAATMAQQHPSTLTSQQPLPPQEQQPQAHAAPEQPRGLMGRAMQFANAMMQKLHDYFDAKLPPSVMNEVKSIGLTMAAAGMKEAPLPTGPEMGGRGQEQLPGRGADQGQQRG
jgi:peptidoglycan hydrolase-like protein with peptidoglycan-binding domain